MKSLHGKVVVVTGAGSGMGREIALLCAQRGAITALADFNAQGVGETAQMIREIGGSCSLTKVDVSNLDDMRNFAAGTVERHGVVDVVFNNAGIIHNFERFEASDYGVMERMLAVNLWGVVYGTREFLPHLLKRPEAALVNTSSVAGLLGYLGMAPYVASKFAVRGFTEALRMEYSHTNLKVCVVHPGAIATKIKENSPFLSEEDKRAARADFADQKKMSRLTSAKDAARQIVDGMQAGKARIIVGRDARVQDVLARLLPTAHTRLFYKFLKSMLS